MSVDLNSLLQQLNKCTEDYPAEEVLNELRIVSERVTFAQIHTDQTAENQSLQKDIEYLLSRDVSPQVMDYVNYLMQNNMLGLLGDDMGQVFINHCQTHFLTIKQLVFKTAVGLRDEIKQQIREKLRQAHPQDTRVLFDTDTSLLAGFVIESRGELRDLSLKNQAAKLLESFIKEKTASNG
jgi:F0F1-type ATP synthase delta subunit